MHFLQLTAKMTVIPLLGMLIFLFPGTVYAATSETSATLASPQPPGIRMADNRAKALEDYLRGHNSPLSTYAQTFITEADKNRIDWELLPAIAGVESTFGQNLPADSHNGWGFGIYGNNVLRFGSWEEAIRTIAKSLRQDYFDRYKATTVESIGSIYAADRSWSIKVRHFMNEIDAFEGQESDARSLTVSL